MVDQAFTGFLFKSGVVGTPATDTRVDRTMPDRLSDIVNVKDWGATGNGSTNDAAAIQAAINYALGLVPFSGAIVFLPRGTYNVGNTTINLHKASGGSGSIHFIGAGRDATIVRGNINGWILLCNPGNNQACQKVADMTVINDNTTIGSGCLVFTSVMTSNQHVQNCHFKGMIGCAIGNGVSPDAYMHSVRDCIAESIIPLPTSENTTESVILPIGPNPVQGSVGIICSDAGIYNCLAIGCDVGFSSNGQITAQWYGNRAYRCRIGFMPGMSYDTNNVQVGFAMCSNWADRCLWGVFLYGVQDALLAGNVITGTTGPFDAATISGINHGGTTATVTTINNHNLATSPSGMVALQTNPPGWTPDLTGTQIVAITVTGAKTFTYTLAANPGSFTSATWSIPAVLGIEISTCKAAMIVANVMSAMCRYCSFDTVFTQSNPDQQAITCYSMRGPYGWVLPNPADAVTQHPLGKYEFYDCGVAGAFPPVAFCTMGQLGGYEGQQITVKDAAVQTSFGGIVTGVGSNHYKIRYDGTNWTRVA